MDSHAGCDGLMPVAQLLSTLQKAVVHLCAGPRVTQELSHLPIGIPFVAAGVLLGAVSSLYRLLHGSPGPFRLVLGFGNSFIQSPNFTDYGCQLLVLETIDVELDDAVGERCCLLGARRREGNGDDARATFLDGSGVAFELVEGGHSCAFASAKRAKPDMQSAHELVRRFRCLGALRRVQSVRLSCAATGIWRWIPIDRVVCC